MGTKTNNSNSSVDHGPTKAIYKRGVSFVAERRKEEHSENEDDDEDPFDYFDAMDVLYFEHAPKFEKWRGSYREGWWSSSSSSSAGSTSTSCSSEEKEEEKHGGASRRHVKQRALALAAKKRAQFEQQIMKRRRQLGDKMREPSFVMTIDKVSFVVGVMNIIVTEGVLLCAPRQLGQYYTLMLIPLMLVRYYLYRKDKWHYFMYDFCYYTQVLTLMQLHRYPDSERFAKINFALTNGPLAMAVVLWRNSLVFHSFDKMTSSFVHMMPPLVTFSTRWYAYIESSELPPLRLEPMTESAWQTFLDLLFYPFLAYLLWQGLYLFKTEVYSKRKLRLDTEIMTSLRWLTRKEGTSSYRIINRFGEKYQTAAFVLYQGIYTVLTLIPVPLMWHSFAFHSLYLACIFLVGLMNGASYYFGVFAARYVEKLKSSSSIDKM